MLNRATDRYEGMRVVVTGAASGIGRATAELLLQRGANIAFVDHDFEVLHATCDELAAKHPGIKCDIRSADDCDAMVATAVGQLGGIDALVHSAGVLRPAGSRPRPLYELDETEYDFVVGTNLRGTFLVNRAVLQCMIKQKSGQIVNLSSTSGQKGRPLDSLYSASKAAVIGLSESIAEEVRPFGIRVQVVLPDAVDTPLWKQNGPYPVAPPGALAPERVAEVISMCLSLPMDTTCGRLVVEPFRKRKAGGRKRKSEPANEKS